MRSIHTGPRRPPTVNQAVSLVPPIWFRRKPRVSLSVRGDPGANVCFVMCEGFTFPTTAATSLAAATTTA